MAQTRLTNDMRGQINDAAVSHRFSPLVAELVEDFRVLAQEVYEGVYGDVAERMNALPVGWLPEATSMSVKFGGDYITLQFSGAFAGRSRSLMTPALTSLEGDVKNVYRRVPFNRNGQTHANLNAREALSTRFTDLKNKAEALSGDVDKARADLGATLEKFTTKEKLLEGWPEIEPFTRGVGPTPKAPMPAVPVAKLNEMLGLPV